MMNNFPIGRPISILKRQLLLKQTIEPATEMAIRSARESNLAETLTHLKTGFSANPNNMAETLIEKVMQLPKNLQKQIFTTINEMPTNKTLSNLLENIQGTITEVKGISKRSLDFSMKKLFVVARENGCDLNLLIRK